MKQFFMSLRIRVKLLAAFGSILLLSVLLIVFSVGSINRIVELKELNEEVDNLTQHLETMDLATKEFLYEDYRSKSFLEEQEAPSLSIEKRSYDETKAIINRIRASHVSNKEETDRLTVPLIAIIDSLQQEFGVLRELLQRRGFRDYGLEGKLRKAIHQVENSGFTFDKAEMLTLRRHEKDFFLRKDLKYQQEFNTRFETFSEHLKLSASPELMSALSNYREEFNNVVAIEKQIGLTATEGIRGRIHVYFEHVRPLIEGFSVSIKQENETQISYTKKILWIIFLLQIIAGLVMALLYAGLLTKSIKEIRNAMLKLAGGTFPDKLEVRTTEEIGQTKQAFNQFVDRLECATSFAEKLGSGQLKTEYDPAFADDVLAQSLVTAQYKLREAEERQSRINWINQGAAGFNDILKTDTDNKAMLAEQILRYIVRYLQVNQGAIYEVTREAGNDYVQALATYAYDKKRFVDHKMDMDSAGVVGECIREQSTVYMKQIPVEYVRITSGLGEATPRNILIVPMRTRTETIGVIELASFQLLEQHHIEFVEHIAENIAALLAGKKVNEDTRLLLEQAQQRASMLATQEETMRQNAEEMHATQEEFENQRKHLEEEIKRLKERQPNEAQFA